MQETKPQQRGDLPLVRLRRFVLLGGSFIAGASIAWTVAMHFTGAHASPERHWLFVAVPIVHAIVLAITLGATKVWLDFRGMLKMGIATTAVAGLLAFAGTAATVASWGSEHFESLERVQRADLLARGYPHAEADDIMRDTAPSRTPTGHAVAGLMSILATGLVFTVLISSGIHLRRSLRESSIEH